MLKLGYGNDAYRLVLSRDILSNKNVVLDKKCLIKTIVYSHA